MSMVETTKKFIEEMKDLTNDIKVQMLNSVSIADMDAEEFMLMKKTFKLMKTATDYTLQQAEIIDEQNKKLDELLEMQKVLLKQFEEVHLIK